MSYLVCQTCSYNMKNIAGMGSDPKWICSNTKCPSKFPQKCPACDGLSKEITIIGMGNVKFTCLNDNCNHSWMKD